jgi:hypothetical protein
MFGCLVKNAKNSIRYQVKKDLKLALLLSGNAHDVVIKTCSNITENLNKKWAQSEREG